MHIVLSLFSYFSTFVLLLIIYERVILWRRKRRAEASCGLFILSRTAAHHSPLIGPIGRFGELENLKSWINDNVRRHEWRAFGASLPIAGLFNCVTSDPGDLRFALSSPNAFPKGRRFIDMLYDFLGDGIFNSDGDTWKQNRQAAAFMFSANRLRKYSEQVFSRDSALACDLFKEHARQNREFDMQAHLTALTLQSFLSIAFGISENELRLTASKGKSEFSRAFDATVLNIGLRIVQPWWKINKLFNRSTEAPLSRALPIVKQRIREIVRDRLAKNDKNSGAGDLLSLYLERARKTNNDKMMSRSFLEHATSNSLLAARDTSASLLTSAVRMLDAHPDWRNRLEDEADDLLADHASLDYDCVKKAELLEAFLLEVGRLYPPVSIDFKVSARHCVLPGSGVVLEPGDRFTYQIWGVCTNPQYWGSDSLVFDPSRWHGDGKRGPPAFCKDASTLAFYYPTFNAGPRTCLGKRLAMVESKIFLIEFFRQRLRFKVSNPIPDDQWDGVFTSSAVNFYRNGLIGKITER